jgi:hypothetical protein
MSESVEIDYILNLQLGDMDYKNIRSLEISFVKIGSIINRVFPDSDAAKIFQDITRMINELRQVQQAIRATQALMRALKVMESSDPIFAAINAGTSIASAALTVYEGTTGTY